MADKSPKWKQLQAALVVANQLAHMLHIWEVQDSNSGPETSYPE
jgi:hypothetical protein